MFKFNFKKMFQRVFGKCETFEGDDLILLIDLSTMFFRNKNQAYISSFILCSLAYLILRFIIYALSGAELNDVVKFLPVEAIMMYASVTYFTYLTQKKELTNAIKELSKTVVKYGGTVNNATADRILKETKHVIKLAIINSISILMYCLMLSPWFSSDLLFSKTNIYDILGENIFSNIIITIYICHIGLCSYTPTLLYSIYNISRIKFQLYILIDKLEELNCTGVNNCLVYNRAYQCGIYEKLKQCFQHHNDIKRCHENLKKISARPLFMCVLVGVLVMAPVVICITSRISPENNIQMFLICILANIVLLQYSLLAQSYQDEYENLYTTICNSTWYNWDKKNRKLLQIFIQNAQQTPIVSFYGLLNLNNECTTAVYKIAYSLIAFYHSMTAK